MYIKTERIAFNQQKYAIFVHFFKLRYMIMAQVRTHPISQKIFWHI
jgi:hypothetical protein